MSIRKTKGKTVYKVVGTFAAVAAISACLSGQVAARPRFFTHGVIVRHGSTKTVYADFPDPLWQALRSVSEKFGWTIDYEGPKFYSQYDVVDDTSPVFLAKHPDARHVFRENGGAFQSTFAIPAGPRSASAEKSVLDQIVADYNRSGNPGQYVVRPEPGGRFDVVGIGVHNRSGQIETAHPILDTRISLPVDCRTIGNTITSILQEINSSSAGPEIVFADSGHLNMMMQRWVSVGGKSIPARDLLREALTQLRWPQMSWRVGYSTDTGQYAMLLFDTLKAATINGRTVLRNFPATPPPSNLSSCHP